MRVNRDDAFAAGCDDFLAKPFRADDLLARIGRLLQIDWQRDTTTAAAPTFTNPDSAGTPPPAVLVTLLGPARRGDVRGLRQALDLASATYPTWCEQLRPLIALYQMDRIREHVETALRTSPAPD